MNTWIKRLQAFDQHLVRSQIGGGHWRVIRLGGHRDVGAPERQDYFPGQSCQLYYRGEQWVWQVLQGIGHGWNSPRWVSRSRVRYSAASARPSLNWAFCARLDSSRRLIRSTRIGSGSSPSSRSS
ncbi:hypothetical protein ALP29_201003 [Pseudomonas syringae pv. avii]|uniref:Uncharacterized protein n=1 Tax=Pseudomonas syringae pv. avii TaxID=663959 RepID=A0A3M5VJY7_PSESX|nr:hypothetical protein ALP29_201003 [Pseudomonas syringae pv. avii]